MNKEEFVSFWSQRYDTKRYDEKTCTGNIGEVTRERILKLFVWKNGSRLSGQKLRSVERNFIDRIGKLDNCLKNGALGNFSNCLAAAAWSGGYSGYTAFARHFLFTTSMFIGQ